MTPTKLPTAYMVFFQEFTEDDPLYRYRGIHMMAGIKDESTGQVMMYSNLNARAVHEVITELFQGTGVINPIHWSCQ